MANIFCWFVEILSFKVLILISVKLKEMSTFSYEIVEKIKSGTSEFWGKILIIMML